MLLFCAFHLGSHLRLKSPLDVFQTVEEVAFFVGNPETLTSEDDPAVRQLHMRMYARMFVGRVV